MEVSTCQSIPAVFMVFLTYINWCSSTVNHEIHLESTEVLNIVSPAFLSVTLPAVLPEQHWKNFNFTSRRLQALARALSPVMLRFGGTEADFLIFDDSYKVHPPYESYKNFTMSKSDWVDLNNFCASVGWQLLFDLNVLLRRGDDWDPGNALHLLNCTVQQGFYSNVHFQLGNEPNALQHAVGMSLPASQLAKDYTQLHSILRSPTYRQYFNSSEIIGPAVTKPKVEDMLSKPSDQYLHQYYINGRTATVDNFTDPAVMQLYLKEWVILKDVIQKAGFFSKPVWLDETGSAWGGGAPYLSNSYVAGFLWLDKLGCSAASGIHMLMRQTFYGGHYAMISEHLDPLPDYWLSLLYKVLAGEKVLSLTMPHDKNLRLYAHCTNLNRTGYAPGSVTLYGMNLNKESMELSIPSYEGDVDIYWLTPQNNSLTSKKVLLNGRKLRMNGEEGFPSLKPRRQSSKRNIYLPPLSFGFIVLPDAKVKLCL